ncbi:hypothetical protein GCM10010275_30290 [Streptomyces litmocidini]|uniref:hypothetical protein n=1 Tax=Streptomyces litmocidini TaxID=67318 RepID=UPI00167D2E2C|nr:hypothetical protein [Streptomyces litmocidini]GGU91142.1 hypothetical protein GCM10010275_30290 [Streptomyces litmocidini]
MSTTVPTRTCGNSPAAPLTVDRLLSAPLPELLASSNAQIVDSSITDAGFYGAAVQRRDGGISLHLPKGRSAAERDVMVRSLVGRLISAIHENDGAK